MKVNDKIRFYISFTRQERNRRIVQAQFYIMRKGHFQWVVEVLTVTGLLVCDHKTVTILHILYVRFFSFFYLCRIAESYSSSIQVVHRNKKDVWKSLHRQNFLVSMINSEVAGFVFGVKADVNGGDQDDHQEKPCQ